MILQLALNIHNVEKILIITTAIIAGVALLALLISVIVGIILTRKARQPISDNPANHGLSYEDIAFMSHDGKTELKGWLIHPAMEPKLTIIMSHGYGGNRHEPNVGFMRLAKSFVKRGYRVVMFDFRNAGHSGGRMTTVGVKEKLDLLGAIHWVKTNTEEPILLYGISMGAATSLLAGSMTDDVIGIIADSPYSDLRDYLSKNLPVWTKLPHFPFTPLILQLMPRLVGLNLGEASPISVLKHIHPKPILFIHGDTDSAIPFTESIKMHEKHPDAFSLWITKGADHVKSFELHTEEYLEKVIEFIEGKCMTAITRAFDEQSATN